MNKFIEVKNEHIKEFGVEPYIIGMYWSNIDRLISNIINAIETNKPYNEYEMLTQEEKIAFDGGELNF